VFLVSGLGPDATNGCDWSPSECWSAYNTGYDDKGDEAAWSRSPPTPVRVAIADDVEAIHASMLRLHWEHDESRLLLNVPSWPRSDSLGAGP
jgi:hypothetical protein